MKRRDFLRVGAFWAGAATAVPAFSAETTREPDRSHRFQLRYAPHFGQFKNMAGHDPLDQLQFAAAQGFTAWEDSGLRARPAALQRQMGDRLANLGMQMGAFMATASFQDITFARQDRRVWRQVLQDVRESVLIAQRVGARWLTVVPGQRDPDQNWRRQTAQCIELLKRCCQIAEAAGVVLVIEPLNARSHHPGCFVHSIRQAAAICRAVGSPSCKILLDLYYQHDESGLLADMEAAWDQIAYLQCGDWPGRKEPGTGQIDYPQVIRYLKSKGYQGVLGMEHGNSLPGVLGERAVIAAYRRIDRA